MGSYSAPVVCMISRITGLNSPEHANIVTKANTRCIAIFRHASRVHGAECNLGVFGMPPATCTKWWDSNFNVLSSCAVFVMSADMTPMLSTRKCYTMDVLPAGCLKA